MKLNIFGQKKFDVYLSEEGIRLFWPKPKGTGEEKEKYIAKVNPLTQVLEYVHSLNSEIKCWYIFSSDFRRYDQTGSTFDSVAESLKYLKFDEENNQLLLTDEDFQKIKGFLGGDDIVIAGLKTPIDFESISIKGEWDKSNAMLVFENTDSVYWEMFVNDDFSKKQLISSFIEEKDFGCSEA